MKALLTIVFASFMAAFWFTFCVLISETANTPGFRNEPPTDEEIQQRLYKELPEKIMHKSDSIVRAKSRKK